ncbi:hypothetical protein KSF_086460 [Reticulibacter mediterranei]|uniref:Uncharacterized protein n=1 Tax=Reticulibacter mediterranei TaxID=2778369 RepID=A0A8J3IQW3_9CHLR|nr:hypothetical protein KSF_086460 [Reticulibacter mediterranei]
MLVDATRRAGVTFGAGVYVFLDESRLLSTTVGRSRERHLADDSQASSSRTRIVLPVFSTKTFLASSRPRVFSSLIGS